MERKLDENRKWIHDQKNRVTLVNKIAQKDRLIRDQNLIISTLTRSENTLEGKIVA